MVAVLAAIGVGGAIYSDMNKPPPPEWETVSLEELGLPPDYDPFADERGERHDENSIYPRDRAEK